MAVFLAASDESEAGNQTGPFVYGGFVGPVLDWMNRFSPVWQKRVLDAEPCIEYFHTAQIKSPTWQAQNGFTRDEAEARIQAAVSVIADMPFIKLARAKVDGGHFRKLFGKSRMIKQTGQPGTYRMLPDYVGFLGFARGVLEYVHDNHPEAERVDFIVERKTTVSHYLPNYLNMIVDWAKREKRHALLALVGDVMSADKARAPLQAADLAMWHIRNHEAGLSKPDDIRRLAAMFNDRPMTLNEITNEDLTRVAARTKDLEWRNSSPPKPRSRGGVA
jgi:hypothetical protein